MARTASLGIPGYENATLVGEGGFAKVYRARQPDLNRLVAVKVLSKMAPDERGQRRFDRERATVGALSGHPNIVTVYESGFTDEGVPYLAMEYVPGGSLGDRLAREGALAWPEVVHIGIRLAGALESAHRAGILHRDVKPENVLLSEFGEPQLSDFGIARVVAVADTRTVERNFSVAHAAPEVLDGDDFSARSDVYALGSTLFALLWGRPAFLRDDDELLLTVVMRITRQPPPDLRAQGVPEPVCVALERALAKQPGERHDSALALAGELQQAQVGAGLPRTTPLVIAEPEQVPEPLRLVAEVTTAPRRTAPHPGAGVATPAGSHGRRWAWLAIPAVLALVVAAVVTLARPGDDPAATSGATAVPAVEATPPAPSFPPGTAAVPAGTYVASRFAPSFEFAVPEGWRSPTGEGLNYLDLVRAAGDPESLVLFLHVRQVVDPQAAPLTPEEARAAMQAGPADLLAWLRDHPRLRTTAPVPVTAGALTGTVVDATPIGAYAHPSCTADQTQRGCVSLFESDDDAYVLPEGARARFYVLPMGDEVLLAIVEAPTARFDAFAAEADQVLSTLRRS